MASSMRAIPNRTALHSDYYTTAKKSALRLKEAFMRMRNQRACCECLGHAEVIFEFVFRRITGRAKKSRQRKNPYFTMLF
jgi:hypothetical protein